MSEQLAREVRDFWLDPGRLNRSANYSALMVRERFGALLEQAAAGELSAWTGSPRRSLSLIILLDQFSRIIHQGSPRAYACDGQALAITLAGFESGADAALSLIERLYFCMPLQRAESLAIQEESLLMFERLAKRRAAPNARLRPRLCAPRSTATISSPASAASRGATVCWDASPPPRNMPGCWPSAAARLKRPRFAPPTGWRADRRPSPCASVRRARAPRAYRPAAAPL